MRQDDTTTRPLRWKLAISGFLLVTTLIAFWSVRNHEFVNYDDDLYVTNNAHVQSGLTWDGVRWAMTTTEASNWHPLTWLSHMVDYDIYKMNPGGHHVTNVLFHVVNTLLLFLILHRVTEDLWKSAFVAMLFAIHPLHVESVAWVAERKDVLSGLLWLATTWAYLRYVDFRDFGRYMLTLCLFALGLMAKPMLVTLPLTLLLLDYWPLGRFQPEAQSSPSGSGGPKRVFSAQKTIIRLTAEKAPFFLLAAVSCVITLLAQGEGGSVASFESLPLDIRIANALVSYVKYIGKMFWPVQLSALYPLNPQLAAPMFSPWQVAGSCLLLLGITGMAIWARRRFPYFIVGWLWYVGTLVPVIGLVQVGVQSMADRYTYLPLIGLFVVMAWGAADLMGGFRYKKYVCIAISGIVVVTFMALTLRQVQYWRNTMSLFRHALAVTDNNCSAHYNLGTALATQGRLKEAMTHFTEAIRIQPLHANAHNNLGLVLAMQGQLEEAIGHYKKAIRLRADNPESHFNLGTALAREGHFKEAIDHFHEALRIKPDYAKARHNLKLTLQRQQRLE
jgi:tetratricopeptide (TPR) repeat protein